jgi:hypothetical protein
MKVIMRNMLLATISALMLLSISATSVFAAGFVGGSSILNSDQSLESRWKNQLNTLQRYEFLDNQTQKWIDEWAQTHPSLHRRARKNRYANEVHLTVQQAEMLVATHPGFDAKGRVIDKSQATQSVRHLEIYLRQMRIVFLHKFHHHVHKHKK